MYMTYVQHITTEDSLQDERLTGAPFTIMV